MRRVRSYKSKKLGFTLIEIVLVMAILVLMIGTFFAVFRVINISHAKVAVVNDAKDYVELNMEAITNLIVNSSKITFCTDPTWSVGVDDPNSKSLYYDSLNGGRDGLLYFLGKGETATPTNPIFTYDQYKIGNGTTNKWYIKPTFSLDTTNPTNKLVKVKLDLYDNSSSSTSPYWTLTRSIYVPNLASTSNVGAAPYTVMKCLRTTLG